MSQTPAENPQAEIARLLDEIRLRDSIIERQAEIISRGDHRPGPKHGDSTYTKAVNAVRPVVDKLPQPVKDAAYSASHKLRALTGNQEGEARMEGRQV